MQWLEDIVVGSVIDLGSHHFTAEEIVAFARDFDPQPFHLDEAAGRASLFRGLAASGWHTTAVWQRLMTTYEVEARKAAGIDARPPADLPPVDSLRWLKPTLAGDTLRFQISIEAVSPPPAGGWGLVTYRAEGINQANERLFELIGRTFAKARAAG